jgi:hypothetical protein
MKMKRFALAVAFVGIFGLGGIQASSASSFKSLGLDDIDLSNGTPTFYSTITDAASFFDSLKTFVSGHGFDTTVTDFVKFFNFENYSSHDGYGHLTAAQLYAGAAVWQDPSNVWYGTLSFNNLTKSITFTATNFQGVTSGGTIAGVPGPIAGAGLPIAVALAGGLLAWRRRSAA